MTLDDTIDIFVVDPYTIHPIARVAFLRCQLDFHSHR